MKPATANTAHAMTTDFMYAPGTGSCSKPKFASTKATVDQGGPVQSEGCCLKPQLMELNTPEFEL